MNASHPSPDIIPLWDTLPSTPRMSATGQYCDPEGFIPSIHLYLCPGEKRRPFVLICPDGGYAGRTGSERDTIAEWLNSLGMHAAVLFYRVKPWLHPTALTDGRRALQIVRERAYDYHIDSERINVIGFSAGGHLAGSLALVDDPLPDLPHVPLASALLAYPVGSFSEPDTHVASRDNLLGPDPSAELREQLSLEKRVTDTAPPMFLWHAADDEVVSAGNSLLLCRAYMTADRPVSTHIFPAGGHGLPDKDAPPLSLRWTDLAEDWYRDLGMIP